MQQTSCCQYMQARSTPSAGINTTSIADTSDMLAFSSPCMHYTPKLPSAKSPGQHAIRLAWSIASDVHTLHAKLSTITKLLIPTQLLQSNTGLYIDAQCSWLQHCHDTRVSGEVIQAMQMLTNDLQMQTRSLAMWEPTARIALQTCEHISVASLGLLIPCAVTVILQATQLVAFASLLQSLMMLTKALPRKRMQCSIQHYLLKTVYCVDNTLRQVNGTARLSSLLCDAMIVCSSAGLGMREVQLHMSATEVVCIAGLMIGILVLRLMSKYEDLLIHATWNNQRTQVCKFDNPKCANGKYWSRIRYFQRKSLKYQAKHPKAQSWLHQSRECVKVVISRLCKILLAPLKLIRRCIWRSKDDTRTAQADSQHSDQKGGNSNEVNQHGLQAQQAHGAAGLYMERQVRKFCQVHALNAMLGRNAIQLGTMLKIMQKTTQPSSEPEAWYGAQGMDTLET